MNLPVKNAEEYERLTADCRSCRACGDDLQNPTGCKHPSTWAMWLGKLDAKIVVVGQDPAGADNVDAKDAASYAPGPLVGTNITLKHLLEAAEIDLADVYLTNAVLCIKPGSMKSSVRQRWVTNCRPLLRRTIDLVRPRCVVALGGVAWNSVCRSYGAFPLPLRGAIERPPILLPGSPALRPMFHCGPLGQASRHLSLQIEDWKEFGQWMRRQVAPT